MRIDPALLTLWQRPAIRRVTIGAGVVTALAVVGCAAIQTKERELTFRVVPGTASWYQGLPDTVQEMDLPVASQGAIQHIHAWWWPAGQNAPALLYLHGARWNLTGQMFRIEQLHEFGFSVLAIDYRGFGKSDSEGDVPSEASVYEDAAVAWRRLTELAPDPTPRFIYGHSLGGAIAIDLAAHLSEAAEKADKKAPANGLVVESSFTTLADMAREVTWSWVPVQLLLTQTFDSIDKIGHVRMPVLIAHGADDRFVPSRFSERLYEAAPEPKKLLLVNGGTHNNSMRIGNGEYKAALHEFFGLKLDGAPEVREVHSSGSLSGATASVRAAAILYRTP
jgi:alpha-beta hydrolase superfamily lysophospholipase